MILREGQTIPVKQPDLVLEETIGFRRAMLGNQAIAQEGECEMAQACRLALLIRDAGIHSGVVAHLGGGFGMVARLLGPGYTHRFYEIEEGFRRFLEPLGKFIPGDWRDTYDGDAAVVVIDMFGQPMTDDELEFLRANGAWVVL